MEREIEIDVTRTTRGTVVADAGTTDVARGDLISWSSVVAGVLAAFGLFVLFGAIALAAGLEAEGPDAFRLGGESVGLIISGLLGVLAFVVGGFIAAWTAHVDEADSAIMHGFLVWALFVALLMVLVAMGIGTALGTGNIFSGAFEAPDADAASDAAWGSVFAIVIAMASSILGALLATRDEIAGRFARRS